MMAVGPAKAITMWNSSNSRLIALLVAVLLPSLAHAQPTLPDQTTVVDSQQITVYDATLGSARTEPAHHGRTVEIGSLDAERPYWIWNDCG